jgi:pSer/pThr/pTyr-binding forkhead associated (FHA) protein
MLSSEQTVALPPDPSVIGINPTPKPGDQSEVDTITLSIKLDQIRVVVPKGHEVLLGRSHPSNPTQPHVDLTQYGGMTSGTSRLHAAIRHDEAGWWLKDLGSSNGTWLNGERVAPLTAYRLEPINHVWLAKLELRMMLPVIPFPA